MCAFTSRMDVPWNGFGEGGNQVQQCSGESTEVNVSDQDYEV